MKTVPAAAFLVLAGILASPPTVAAEPAMNTSSELSSDILGSWAFSTDDYAYGYCQMTGTMTVFPSRDRDDVFDCELTAVEVCGGARSVVAQTCEIRAEGDQYLVESEIEQFIERMPDVIGEYLPDHFVLTDVSADEMIGQLLSASTAPVRFVRNEGNIS